MSDAPDLASLLAAKEIAICCGAGGVGKTTIAASLAAIAAARLEARVLVVTVDPAKRLADALGLRAIGNTETRIDDAVFRASGVTPRGELWAAMLDTKQSWDELVERHAPDAATRDAILANPLYANLTAKFVQSHDYIAVERLYDIHAAGGYDLVIVDTPPSRHALDLLDAPARMADFFDSRLLRWLTVPYRSRLVTMASRPFYQLADRVLGAQFLQDIADFFILFQTLHGGFVPRARAVERLLADRRTTYVVVSTLETGPLTEAEFFLAELARRELQPGALVLNRVLPPWLRDPEADRVAARMVSEPRTLAQAMARTADAAEPEQVARVLAEAASGFRNLALAAAREAEQRLELRGAPELVATVPLVSDDIADLPGLLALAERLWS